MQNPSILVLSLCFTPALIVGEREGKRQKTTLAAPFPFLSFLANVVMK